MRILAYKRNSWQNAYYEGKRRSRFTIPVQFLIVRNTSVSHNGLRSMLQHNFADISEDEQLYTKADVFLILEELIRAMTKAIYAAHE